MRIETIFEMTSPYRDNFRIAGYRFGEGEKTLAIIGAMRGDEVQQQYICSQIVSQLSQMEQHGEINAGNSILVIPSCNPFSMNVGRRFWAMDNTDINRMFPGYEHGETTQRIATAIFSAINGFKFGIQMASYYVPGNFIPHVRMLTTGYEDIATAKLFGMKYVTTYKPRPFDTTLLNYNWQLWGTKAFSVYAGHTNQIDTNTSEETISAILRMMKRIGITSKKNIGTVYESEVVDEANLLHIKAQHAGIFCLIANAGKRITQGETIAQIIDPYNGQIISNIEAPTDGIIFFAHNKPLVFQNALLFMIIGK